MNDRVSYASFYDCDISHKTGDEVLGSSRSYEWNAGPLNSYETMQDVVTVKLDYPSETSASLYVYSSVGNVYHDFTDEEKK